MALGDILIVGDSTDRVYRYSDGSWDSGIAVPSGETDPHGVTVDPANGDILIVGASTDRVYRYSNGSWDSGIAVPSAVINPVGITTDPDNGDVVVLGFSTGRFYRYSNGSWDSGIAVPSGETFPLGITIDPDNGDVLIVGAATGRFYRYSNGSWDSGIAVPSGESVPQGITVDPDNGDVLIIGDNNDRVYRYSDGSWDSGIAVPSGESVPQGITVDGYAPAPLVPDAPATPTVSDIQRFQATVNWVAPDSNGFDITSYDLESRKVIDSFWTEISDLTSTSYTLTGLDADDDYQARVRATNSEGDSDWSDHGQFTTLAQPTARIQAAISTGAPTVVATVRTTPAARASPSLHFLRCSNRCGASAHNVAGYDRQYHRTNGRAGTDAHYGWAIQPPLLAARGCRWFRICG